MNGRPETNSQKPTAMKHTLIITALLLISMGVLKSQDFDPFTCTFKGKELYGKVLIVENYADIRVELVNYDADLEVDTAESYPSQCGEWKFVKDHADFKIQFVTYGGDIKIHYVNYNPGIPDSKKKVPDNKVNTYNCSFKGLQLYGKVKVVESFPDIKVKVVTSFPDLKVQVVDNFPNDCGKWQFVESFPDLKIQFVESFEDIKVEFVNSFPGLK
jgi:hypothetical protein